MQITRYLFIDRVITEHSRASTQWKAGTKMRREKKGECRRGRGKQGKTRETEEDDRENQEENIYWGSLFGGLHDILSNKSSNNG